MFRVYPRPCICKQVEFSSDIYYNNSVENINANPAGGHKQIPVLSTFYGLIIRMYEENDGKHNMPHIHVEYSGDEAVVGLDGTVIEGKLPKNKMKLLDAWLVIHQEDLEANWKLLSNGEQYFRIDPLK